ncbi:alpha/beta hydrolase [Roseisolibacter agri]|uniref:Alpha/beta hydrolase n=2 Tax=Roseisolibacter agri TaxID=2014610 RepID=A0AA37Q7I7_9BACT|nr:alpha/beta hydrolase [Roseisolibacter agri]
MLARHLLRLATCAVVGAAAPLALFAQMTAPAPTGPHAVGRRLLTWVDSARRDPTDTTHARTITAWLWYPAAKPARVARGDAALQPALDGAWGDLRATASAAKIGDAAAAAMRGLRVHAVTDAPWARDAGRAPVLVFTPGNGWLPTDYGVMLEDLASHGYAVVGVAPAGLADVVVHGDGRVVPKTLGVGAAIADDQRHAHDDVLHVLRQLRALDTASRSPARGRLDLTRVAALGHSLGGTTAIVAAARDTLVRAAMNLDGDAMGAAVLDARPRQPLLFVSSELPAMDEAPAGRDSAWYVLTRQGVERSERRRTGEWARISSRSADARRVRLLGARHLDFTDAALAESLIVGAERRWMRWGPIDGTRALRVTTDLVRAFLDHALLGRPADVLLEHPERRYGELRLVTGDEAGGGPA